MNSEIRNELFEQFKDDFGGSGFHQILWAITEEDYTKGKVCCFISNYDEHGQQLGIAFANEKGYNPTLAYFKTPYYDEAKEILRILNEKMFKVDNMEAMKIQMSSIR